MSSQAMMSGTATPGVFPGSVGRCRLPGGSALVASAGELGYSNCHTLASTSNE